MNKQTLGWSFLCCVLCIFFIELLISSPAMGDTSIVRELIRELGLTANPTDEDVIKLLDDRMKRIPAMSLIHRRRILSAVPKLLEIMNEENTRPTDFLDKLKAAKALCAFGNKEWIEQIKWLLSDPKVRLSISYKIRIAGLLALGGDESQFEIVRSNIAHEKKYVRLEAIEALGKFRKQNDNGNRAAELLLAVMMGDPDAILRARALMCLEHIARERPTIKPAIVSAMEANLDFADENFRRDCQAKLEMYRQDALTASQVIEMLDDRTQFLTAISVITRRKLHSTEPKLLEMVKEEGTRAPAKMLAVRTLLSLGNKDWIGPMKALSADPNISVSWKLSIAGLLAQGGDYSQFGVVEEYLGTGELKVKQAAVRVLGDFGNGTGQVLTRAVELLEATAVGDSDTSLRSSAIASLEKIVGAKPEMKSSLVRAYEANLDSENSFLKARCKRGLKKYRDKSEQ